MSLIRTQKYFPSKITDSKLTMVMCGFGGSVWQAKRLIKVLNRAGYGVVALDFPKTVLSRGDASLLPQLVDDVLFVAEEQAKVSKREVLLVGVSLGALLALNIVRRSELFSKAVLLTRGDIAKIAHRLYPKVWQQPYGELAKTWQAINMYTEPELLKNKRLLFVVHPSSKLIDVTDIRMEVKKQRAAGNFLQLVERTNFDHVGTIVEETILFPKRTLTYIGTLEGESSR